MTESQRRKNRLSQGLCGRCGVRPCVPMRTWCSDCRDKELAKARTPEFRERRNARLRSSEAQKLSHRRASLAHNRKVRQDLLAAYGGKCACCGERTPEFLDIDHIHNDGAKHRKEVGSGNVMHKWIRKNNYPSDLQILCANCNQGKYRSGTGECPHETARRLERLAHGECQQTREIMRGTESNVVPALPTNSGDADGTVCGFSAMIQ